MNENRFDGDRRQFPAVDKESTETFAQVDYSLVFGRVLEKTSPHGLLSDTRKPIRIKTAPALSTSLFRTRRSLAQEDYNRIEGMVHDFVTAPVLVVPCANKTRFESKYGKPAKENARLPWWLMRRLPLIPRRL